jgi:hypothetical protein
MSNAVTDEGIYANGRTYAEHCAWLASLNDDESAIVHTPIGHRWTLVVISETKRMLLGNVPTEHRLRFLEFLDHCTDTFLTAEVVAGVEPMCDEAYEMVKEARKLGAGKALDVFAKWEVFNAFIALNPSILTAIKMSAGRYHHRRSA